MTIAYRVYLDHRVRLRGARTVWEEEPIERGGGIRDPAVLTEQKEQCGLLEAAVAEISPATRAVIVLHYTGGLSLRQVAAAMDISVGTVKSRLNAGLEQLRRRLS
jgi:RNA polymerase sigma-70 factor, ECF subfamily